MWENLPAFKAELEYFEQELLGQFEVKKNLASYLNILSTDVVKSGGKRLRPAMVIASAMLGAYEREKAFPAALSIELLHTATLVHDDIIDDAPLRRGKPTVYAREGISTAVFTGDYLYVKSILTLATSNLPIEYLKQLAQAIEAVCVGEVEQFRKKGELTGFKSYLSRISRKTGVLFGASCVLGAHLGGLTEAQIKHAAKFGGYFGIAFQIKDDLMDLEETPEAIGKPVGNDLKEGILTLPVLIAVAKDSETRETVGTFLDHFNHGKFTKKEIFSIVRNVKKTGSIEETKAILKKYIAKAQRALDTLPDNEGRQVLQYILDKSF